MTIVFRAIVLLLVASLPAVAAPRIPSSDLPGRERYRFIDPPAAGLMQPSAPTTILPYDTRRFDRDCRRPKGKRLRCAPAR